MKASNKQFKNNKVILIIFAILVLLTFEIGFRLFGYGSPTEREDHSKGFFGSYKIYRINKDNKKIYETCPNQYEFAYQTFSVKKEQNVFRIFCLGGSAVGGFPYNTVNGGFPKWVEIILSSIYPFMKFEVINSGAATYGSYRVALVLKEIIKYNPDLIIVYCGNNEFPELWQKNDTLGKNRLLLWFQRILDESRIYIFLRNSLLSLKYNLFSDLIKIRIAKSPTLSPELERQYVLANYESNILNIVRIAKHYGTNIWLLTVATNLKNWAPEGEEIDDEYYLKANGLMGKNDFVSALKLYKQCIKLNNEGSATIHYKIAKCYESLGEYREAKLEYTIARDKDLYRQRAISKFNNILKEICRQEKVKCVDIVKTFETVSPNNLIGNNLFVDHCHLNLKGHILIAKTICNEIVNSGLIQKETYTDETLQKRIQNYQTYVEGNSLVNREEFWLQGKTAYNNGEFEKALYYFKKARNITPNCLHVLLDFGLTYQKLNRDNKAIETFRKMLEIQPKGKKYIQDLQEIQHIKNMAKTHIKVINDKQKK